MEEKFAQAGIVTAQPWTVQEEKTGHTVRLRFTVCSEIRVERALLALEDAIEGVQKSLLHGAVKVDLKAFYQQHKM